MPPSVPKSARELHEQSARKADVCSPFDYGRRFDGSPPLKLRHYTLWAPDGRESPAGRVYGGAEDGERREVCSVEVQVMI